jgi:hypothetical protein
MTVPSYSIVAANALMMNRGIAGIKHPIAQSFSSARPIHECDGEIAMKKNVSLKWPSSVSILAIATLSAMFASPVTYANPSNRIVLVPPTALPALAQQSGEAMFLHGSSRLPGAAIVAPVDQGVWVDDRIVEVKQVRQEVTNAETGTTFLLAEKGLYLIRRPALEPAPEVYLNTGG